MLNKAVTILNENQHSSHKRWCLFRWLLSRIGGVRELSYTDLCMEDIDDGGDTEGILCQRQIRVLVHVLPQLSGLLSQNATLHLDLWCSKSLTFLTTHIDGITFSEHH